MIHPPLKAQITEKPQNVILLACALHQIGTADGNIVIWMPKCEEGELPKDMQKVVLNDEMKEMFVKTARTLMDQVQQYSQNFFKKDN